MKILYVNTLYSPDIKGGAELSLKLLVESMQKQGHEVVVAALQPAVKANPDTVEGVQVYRCKLENHYWPYGDGRPATLSRLRWHWQDRYNAKMKDQVGDIIRMERPDVISFHNLAGWSISVWDAAREHNVPCVQVLHDLYLLCANSDMFKHGRSCKARCASCQVLRLAHRRKSAQLDAVVGISRTILNRFQKFGYFEGVNTSLIYNARVIPDRSSKTEQATFRIGYLGTLASKKGVHWLIEQFRKYVEAHFNIELFIGGQGSASYVSELKLLAEDSTAVHFMGHQQPEAFYNSIDLLVVPSLWEEPLGMVAIEALANHIPVIANASGGLAETVQHERNGLLVDAADPDSLGVALRRLAEDHKLYSELSAQARASVASYLSIPRMVGEYETVLKKVLKAQNRDTQNQVSNGK